MILGCSPPLCPRSTLYLLTMRLFQNDRSPSPPQTAVLETERIHKYMNLFGLVNHFSNGTS